MPLSFKDETEYRWSVKKIAVIGPGIVGMPMAALLARARIREGSDLPARVVVLQRDSETSGWKVDAINAGRSVIGGVEPGLDAIVSKCVDEGILYASHDYDDAADADLVLVCVQTDKNGFEPDYGPLFGALDVLANSLQGKPEENIPIICFESTLAPSTMSTLVRDHFAHHGLVEGKDILLGNSPNRVMPGRLVDRIASADKLVAGLHPLTPILIEKIYSQIVTKGQLRKTNSMTAEVVKTLENAYRDVRIAFATEVVWYCDQNNINFFRVRDAVNESVDQSDGASTCATAVPTGGVLVPMLGVGGHCLPKDGILLWWRRIESGADTSRSLILESRKINDDSPAKTIELAESFLGSSDGKTIALLGTAYRFDSEDTRNSPTLILGRLLLDKGCKIRIHDPYVKPDDQNLQRFGLQNYFTNSLSEALSEAEIVYLCTGHGVYRDAFEDIKRHAVKATLFVDGANLYDAEEFQQGRYCGIGRGADSPTPEFVEFVKRSFVVLEKGAANEVYDVVNFLNANYAMSDFEMVEFREVQALAGTCATGCRISDPQNDLMAPEHNGLVLHLCKCAENGADRDVRNWLPGRLA